MPTENRSNTFVLTDLQRRVLDELVAEADRGGRFITITKIAATLDEPRLAVSCAMSKLGEHGYAIRQGVTGPGAFGWSCTTTGVQATRQLRLAA